MSFFDEKKTRIIETATAVFAEKGFRSSTISDLAKGAGLGEATIYNHFKNKEDILLSIPLMYFQDFLATIHERLTGIKNAEEKLRTFIWQYLWWNQSRKEFVRVFLLEIETIPNYYHSEGFELTKQVVQIPMDILEEGKQAGLFREGVGPRIFRNFLLGTINYLFLTLALFNRPFEPLDDFDELASAMVIAVRKEPEDSLLAITEIEEKKERILLAAEELFFKKMFYDTTISEIARKANVADGTIYEYFKNKEDLLFSIFEKRMKMFSVTFEEALCPQRPENKIRHVLWHFLSIIEKHQQWARVYFKDLIPNPRFHISEHHQAMRDHDAKVRRIFEEGKEKGVFRKDLEMYLFRAMIFGTLEHISSPWAMLQKNYHLVTEIDGFYDLLIRAVKNPT